MPGSEEHSIAERLTRLEAIVETQFRMLLERLDPIITDHENRLRSLERKIWAASGAAIVVGGTIGTVASKLLGA